MLVRLVRDGLRPYAKVIVAILVLQLVATIASLYLPSLNGEIIDRGVARGDTGFIVRTGGVMLAVSVIQILATVVATFFASRAASGMARDERRQVFTRVLDFSAQEVAHFGAPTLISRSTNDVQQVQTVTFMGLAIMVSAPIMMVGGVVMALREDVGLSWLIAIAVPVLGGAVGAVVSRMVPNYRVMQRSVDSVNRILREQITGIRVVRAFVREDAERERFSDANTTYTNSAVAVGRLMALAFPIVMVVFNASTVAVLWFGAKRIDAGEMEIGALTAFMSYLVQVLMSVMMATFMAMMIPRAAVSAGRIIEVLDTATSVSDPAVPMSFPISVAPLRFDDVTFRYPGADAPVLTGISFTADPGTTTAIVGSTGAGKTTLINLVPRLFDVTGGTIRLGEVDIRAAALTDLWARVGLVPQKPYLFTGTIASNLRYGNPDASEADLWRALEIAQASDFVLQMSDGLESPVAQGGTNLSGGQRQRIAIARALVARPAVYLFDDSFSALDTATDARLRSALGPVTRDAVVIVVAQRVATIVDADQIVVVDNGVIVGVGTHERLLEGCVTYQEIVTSQETAEAAA